VIKKETTVSGKYMGEFRLYFITVHIFNKILSVTKDVEGWESYSEDEMVPKSKLVKPSLPLLAAPAHSKAIETAAGQPKEDEPRRPAKTLETNKETSPHKANNKPSKSKNNKNTGQKTLLSFFGKK
jgi:hypothetical protein